MCPKSIPKPINNFTISIHQSWSITCICKRDTNASLHAFVTNASAMHVAGVRACRFRSHRSAFSAFRTSPSLGHAHSGVIQRSRGLHVLGQYVTFWTLFLLQPRCVRWWCCWKERLWSWWQVCCYWKICWRPFMLDWSKKVRSLSSVSGYGSVVRCDTTGTAGSWGGLWGKTLKCYDFKNRQEHERNSCCGVLFVNIEQGQLLHAQILTSVCGL